MLMNFNAVYNFLPANQHIFFRRMGTVRACCNNNGNIFIRHAAWRLSPEDVAWCGDASVLHDVKLSSDMRILLGLSRERRRPAI